MKGWYGNKQAHSLASKGIKTKVEMLNTHLKKIIPNRYIMHSSNPVYREIIDMNGLKIQPKSPAWLEDTNLEGSVIFATNTLDPDTWYHSGYNDDRYVIDTLKLDNNWYLDPNYPSSHQQILAFTNIPKEAITRVYEGTGNAWDWEIEGGLEKEWKYYNVFIKKWRKKIMNEVCRWD